MQIQLIKLCKSVANGARSAVVVALLGCLGGCASGPGANPLDPFEPFNRGVTRFNDDLDRTVLKPVATGYKQVVPSPVRIGVTNFFGNLSDVWSLVNNVLQLKVQASAENFLRVGVNTVFGFAGVIDFASAFNIDRHKEDFGQTLGRWGVGSGPYIVLPALGPSTLRDTLAIGVEVSARADPLRRMPDVAARNSLYALRVVNARANLLTAGQVLNDAALDKYTFTRDVYLQIRRREVSDGKDRDYDKEEPAPASPPAPTAAPPEPAAAAPAAK
jgi:phospholipid-binding lipoprotein MlaA